MPKSIRMDLGIMVLWRLGSPQGHSGLVYQGMPGAPKSLHKAPTEHSVGAFSKDCGDPGVVYQGIPWYTRVYPGMEPLCANMYIHVCTEWLPFGLSGGF